MIVERVCLETTNRSWRSADGSKLCADHPVGLAAAACMALAMVAGCNSSGDLEKIVVSGRVSYQGMPVEEGEIRFAPIKGTKGPASIEVIGQGQYRITARGGVPVGTHRVEVQAFRPIPGAKPYTEEQADGELDIQPGDLPKEQFLPATYNRASTMEVTIEPGQRAVTKDFDLQ